MMAGSLVGPMLTAGPAGAASSAGAATDGSPQPQVAAAAAVPEVDGGVPGCHAEGVCIRLKIKDRYINGVGWTTGDPSTNLVRMRAFKAYNRQNPELDRNLALQQMWTVVQPDKTGFFKLVNRFNGGCLRVVTAGNALGMNPVEADQSYWRHGAPPLSTAADLLVYANALATGQGVLDSATQLDRLTAMAPEGSYGWASGCLDGWFGHTGELPGFNTTVYYDSFTDSRVVTLVNTDIPSGDCEVSKTLPDNSKAEPCINPAVRMLVSISIALGHEFTPNPLS